MDRELRVGIVGLDTSHVVAFTRLLNDRADPFYLPGARVVGAYPGGSAMFSLSRDRVQGFTEELQGRHGVRMYDQIAALAVDVDAILLESVDGRQHLEQFRQLAMGKPVYVDKPLATSPAEARAIVETAEQTGTPLMSGSSLRYAAGIAGLLGPGDQVQSCEAFGPAPILTDYPGLFWYGIHSAEILYTYMGPGCKTVRCISYAEADLIAGEWADGRLGLMRGTRFKANSFGCVVHTGSEARCGLAQSTPPYYYLLLEQVVRFFQTGVSPIDIQETLEIIAFLEAADRSKATGGQVVELSQ